MKKFLSILAAIGLTSTAAISVIACGDKTSSEVDQKTDLSSVTEIKALKEKLTISGQNMVVNNAYASFLKIEGVKDVLASLHLQKSDFDFSLKTPTFASDGSLTISVKKENSAYKGSVVVTITKLEKTDLNSLTTLNKEIKGLPGMTTAIEALDTFWADDVNQVLKGEVEVKEGDWTPPQLGVDGSLTITAKPNSRYTGSITIKVTGYTMKLESLTSALTLTVNGQANLTLEQALENFFKLGDNVILTHEVVIKEGSFEVPTSEKDGKFLLVPKQGSVKYTGELEVIISKLTS